MQEFNVLFYQKNHKTFHAIYQYLQSQRTAILSHGKGNCSITYLLFSPWALLIDISFKEKQKSKGQLFGFVFFKSSPSPQHLLQYQSLCYSSTERDEEMGWSSSKNNRKEKGDGSWGFMTSVRLKMVERRWKKVFSYYPVWSHPALLEVLGIFPFSLKDQVPQFKNTVLK